MNTPLDDDRRRQAARGVSRVELGTARWVGVDDPGRDAVVVPASDRDLRFPRASFVRTRAPSVTLRLTTSPATRRPPVRWLEWQYRRDRSCGSPKLQCNDRSRKPAARPVGTHARYRGHGIKIHINRAACVRNRVASYQSASLMAGQFHVRSVGDKAMNAAAARSRSITRSPSDRRS